MHDLLLKAVSDAFPEDEVRAGLVTSYLGNEGEYYASICRYPGNRREVYLWAKGETLESVLQSLAEKFLGSLGRGRNITALEQYVNSSGNGF